MITLAGRHALRLVPQKTGHNLTASGGSEWWLTPNCHSPSTYCKDPESFYFLPTPEQSHFYDFYYSILWVRVAGNSLASGSVS